MISTPNAKEIPVKIVGSSIFGRHPLISEERTTNLFISDDWLVNFSGYQNSLDISALGDEGRGAYHSVRGNFVILVIDANVYRIEPNLGYTKIYTLPSSSTGEVFMDENLSYQIAIVDGVNPVPYIYNYDPAINNVAPAAMGSGFSAFIPNYVTYQNTFFVFGNGNTDSSGSDWFVFESGYDLTHTSPTAYKLAWVQTLALQTKPDFAKAAIRIPSHGNNLLVLGTTVAEIWTQVAGIQTYQRQSSINIDYGVASVSTIAASDDMVCWLGINEKSSPAIMVMTGGQAQRISTDGIDFLLSGILHPDQSTAMFYRQDGHVFYILTFFNPADDLSIMYDFTTQKFYDLTDWDFTYFPARQMVYFNNQVYFASLKQGALMNISTAIPTYSIQPGTVYDIPRIRKCDTFRLPGSDRFIINQFSFTIANGVDPNVFMPSQEPMIEVSFSKNGGSTYSNPLRYYLHTTGNYKNQPRFSKLGSANLFTIQMRFWGMGDVVAADGKLEAYQ